MQVVTTLKGMYSRGKTLKKKHLYVGPIDFLSQTTQANIFVGGHRNYNVAHQLGTLFTHSLFLYRKSYSINRAISESSTRA